MNTSNESVQENHEFNCCCSITRKHFEIIEQPAFEVISCILTVPTSLTATLGNLLVLISIWRTSSLHTPSNALLVNLALTDLSVGLMATPPFLVSIIAKFQGDAGLYCSIKPAYNILSHSFCSVSIATLTAISLDRYIALRLHLRYKEIVTLRRVCKTIVAIWLLGLLYGVSRTWSFTFNAYFAVVSLALCFIVITVCYCNIHQVIRRHRTAIRVQVPEQLDQQEENSLNMTQYKKSVSNMLLIYFIFLLCYVPYLVARVLLMISDVSLLYSALEFAGALVHINSTLNPLVYCWRFRSIRVAVKETAREIFKKKPSE